MNPLVAERIDSLINYDVTMPSIRIAEKLEITLEEVQQYRKSLNKFKLNQLDTQKLLKLVAADPSLKEKIERQL